MTKNGKDCLPRATLPLLGKIQVSITSIVKRKDLTPRRPQTQTVPQIKMLLNEIEHGIRRKISLEEWGNL